MSPLSSRTSRILKLTFLALVVVTVAFALYLRSLYGQLDEAFSSAKQFVPTRFYSDVTKLAPPMPRAWVQERLTALNYSVESSAFEVRLKLHPIDYPRQLLPEGHPVLGLGERAITLQFDGQDDGAALQSILVTDGASGEPQEIPELYLEPEVIATLSNGTHEIREIVPLDRIPPNVWKAVIAVEDHKFLEHGGFDPRGFLRALVSNLRTLSLSQGGSTITQQLVKNLLDRRGRNLFRKLNEACLAIILELRYSKEQILERYLNEVFFGQVGSLEVHGVSEGARHFFGKALDDITLAEAALLAGQLKGTGPYSPYKYPERAKERQLVVLKRMIETGQVAEEEAEQARTQPLRYAPPQKVQNKAPYFSDYVKAELLQTLKGRMPEADVPSASLRVYTTLDPRQNAAAALAVATQVAALEQKLKLAPTDRLEGALAAVEPATGYLRALIGGKSYATSSFNRILNMRRQVGSTFKPVVYLAAIQKGQDPAGVPYGGAYPMWDGPWKLTYDKNRQSWEPKNYEKGYRGWVTMREALAHSINTATAKLGADLGVDAIISAARALGVQSELPEVPSLSLGVAELTPVELLQIYATIAQHGTRLKFTSIRLVTDDAGATMTENVPEPKAVIGADEADLLTSLLRSVFTEGTASGMAKSVGWTRPAAGKTGTTSHHRDAWFAGFTPQLTAVVWVGKDLENAAPSKISLTGGGSAFPLWASFMRNALTGEAVEDFTPDPGLSEIAVDMRTGWSARPGCPAEQVRTDKYRTSQLSGRESCESRYPEPEKLTQAP